MAVPGGLVGPLQGAAGPAWPPGHYPHPLGSPHGPEIRRVSPVKSSSLSFESCSKRLLNLTLAADSKFRMCAYSVHEFLYEFLVCNFVVRHMTISFRLLLLKDI